MKRPLIFCALFLGTAAFLAAQQSNAPSQYQGVSNPPPDDTITTPAPQPPPQRKPSPAHAMNPAPAQPAPRPAAEPPAAKAAPASADGTDDGLVMLEPETGSQAQPAQAEPQVRPALSQRPAVSDPDGDIVHPAPLPPGTVPPGTMIRARLLDGLSTESSRVGDRFRTRVASDVFRGNDVLIPAGAEIDGVVAQISDGRYLGGHGSMLLRPETVILPNGTRYHLYAQLTGTPGSNTRVNDEGTVAPGSQTKKTEIEYGGGVGAGLVAGAALGGPVGALAGTIVGASAVTVHLLMNHPQPTLDAGTVLDFTLTEPLSLVPETESGQ